MSLVFISHTFLVVFFIGLLRALWFWTKIDKAIFLYLKCPEKKWKRIHATPYTFKKQKCLDFHPSSGPHQDLPGWKSRQNERLSLKKSTWGNEQMKIKTIKKTNTTPSCSGPIPAQKTRGHSVLGVVFSHTMHKMDFHYSHCFSWEKHTKLIYHMPWLYQYPPLPFHRSCKN